MSETHETEDHHSPSRKDLYVVLVLTPLLIIGAGYGLARFYFKPAEAGLQLQLEQLATKLGALTNVHSAGNHGDGHGAGSGGHGTSHSGGHWNYDDKSTEGPAHWGDLKPEFAIASQGIRQSPIDLVESDAISVPELKSIEFRYQPSSMVVTNNGHTIQGNQIVFSPKDKSVSRYLLGGSIFGLGWALSGACPGPMVVNVGYGYWAMTIVFFFALVGTYLYDIIKNKLPH